MILRKLLPMANLMLILAIVLTSCATPTPEKIIETVVIKEEGETVVITATPEPEAPPPPEAITDFGDVPADILKEVCEDVKAAIEYDDEARTLTLHLAAPFAPILQLLSAGWTSPLDQEWMTEIGDWDGDCSNWVAFHDPDEEDSKIYNIENGTGPFKLEYLKYDEEVSHIRNEDYWRVEPMWEGGPSGPAWYDRVIWKIVPEWGTRFAMFLTRDLDIAYVPTQYIEILAPYVAEDCDAMTEECMAINPNGLLRMYRNLAGGTVSNDFFFSMDIPIESTFIGSGTLDGAGIPPDFFGDLNIRKAFASCFDYDTFIMEVAKGEAIQRNGPIPPGYLGYDPNDPPPAVYDLAACEEYFKMADVDHDGIPASEDEDDVWEKGFFLMLVYPTGALQNRVASEILKNNIEVVNENFIIELLALPGAVYRKQRYQRAIPIYPIGWLEDYHHSHNWVQPYLSSAGAYGYYLDLPDNLQSQFDTMIDEARTIIDPAEQEAAYKEIQRLAAEQQTSLWGFQPLSRYYEQMWMQGWFYNPSFPCYFLYGFTESEDSPHPRTFISAGSAAIFNLDPAYMYDTASACQIWRLYDPLIHTKRERYDEFVGQLADRWEISDDGLTYTFHIREGVKFHEGGDLDAHDAAYAIWRGLLQDRAAGPQWMFWDAFFGFESVEDYAIAKANE
jgi:peptide/nickel transport system substrate-binding protein